MTQAVSSLAENNFDPGLVATEGFARFLCAFKECSDEIQGIILEMAALMNDPETTPEEHDAALHTIYDAMTPSGVNGKLGVDLEESESASVENEEGRAILAEMDREEATFAERLQAQMAARDMTQHDLARAIGVGQPAISMMLARKCRPQRRTVEKIAAALGVTAADLWVG